MPVADLFAAAAAGDLSRLKKEFKKVTAELYPDAWQRLSEGRPVGEGLITLPGLRVPGGVTSEKQQVKMVLAALMDPATGMTVGTLAASRDRSNVLRWLKDEGITTYLPDRTGRYPIHLAAARGDLDSVRVLRTHFFHQTVPDSQGCTALHIAARHGHAGVVTELCRWHSKVNARDFAGKTPAHHAAEGGHAEMVQLLARWGADLTARDGWGRTCWNILEEQSRARHVAASAAPAPAPATDAPEVPEVPEVPLPTLSSAELLHSAVRRGHVPMLEPLALLGQDLLAPNAEGQTPLEVAALLGHVGVLDFYGARGVMLGGPHGGTGSTLAQLALRGGHPEVIDCLVKHGVDPLAPGRDGRSVAHEAIERGDVGFLERLHAVRNLEDAFPRGELAKLALQQPRGEALVAGMLLLGMSMPDEVPGLTHAQLEEHLGNAASRAARIALQRDPSATAQEMADHLVCLTTGKFFSHHPDHPLRPVRLSGSKHPVSAHALARMNDHPIEGGPLNGGEAESIRSSDAYRSGDVELMKWVERVRSTMLNRDALSAWGRGRPPPEGWSPLLTKPAGAGAAGPAIPLDAPAELPAESPAPQGTDWRALAGPAARPPAGQHYQHVGASGATTPRGDGTGASGPAP